MKYGLYLGVVFLVGCGQGKPYLQTLGLNKAGNEALQSQSFSIAADKYLQALRYDPFVGQLHLNLGLSFEGLQQYEKALQSYSEAEKLAQAEKNYQLVFMARFNRAQLLAKAKKIDEALSVYQKALELIPSSLEVKTNIELLTQQQQGKGGGEGDQKNQPQDGQDNKDQQNQDQKDQDQKDKDSQEPKAPKQSPKYKPRPFEGKELSEGDVKKILGELKQQEEKIRAEYNRKETKERPRDKDW